MKIFKISPINLKIVSIIILLSLFTIPLRFIDGLIFDRKIHQNEAIQSVVNPLGGETRMEGVFIAFPYKKYEEKLDSNGKVIKVEKDSYIMFSPETCDLDVNVNSYFLTRGIYNVPAFNGKILMNLIFNDLNYGNDFENVNRNEALLLVAFSSKKSLTSIPVLKINNKDIKLSDTLYDFSHLFSNSLCYKLDNINLYEKLELKGEVDFQGGNSLEITPVAMNNNIHMTSNWKTPGFCGGFLPKEREINKDGFNATWNIAGINTVYPKLWTYDANYCPETLKVDLVQHINNYTKASRSVKYAFLFLLIPFVAMFVLEIISKIKIHPIQYILIGITNVIFYLLLISISEHLDFNLTYAICSIAVIFASFIYIISIFKSLKSGYILCSIQLLSYMFLYGTLQSEDYALLIGSIGMFGAVTLFMIITRKIDWYDAGEKWINRE